MAQSSRHTKLTIRGDQLRGNCIDLTRGDMIVAGPGTLALALEKGGQIPEVL